MPDPRDRQLAELLVDTCVGVQPGWQVLVIGTPPGRPLIEEVVRRGRRAGRLRAAPHRVRRERRGAHAGCAMRRSSASPSPPPIEVHALETSDALIVVDAPENTRDLADISGERMAAFQGAYRPAMERLFRHELPWVGCQYPTPALAQEAGMSTEEFADFLYGACLLDWDAERERMQRYADRFDAADEVRIVGARDRPATVDRRAGDEGRRGRREHPRRRVLRLPGRGLRRGRRSRSPSSRPCTPGARSAGSACASRAARVVDASAETNEAYLVEMLDSDDGARRLGELGIGCNPGITRYMRNTLFDEKIDGTVHLALGNGMPDLGGTNESRDPLGHRQGPAHARRADRARRRGRPAGRRVADLTQEPAPPAADRRARLRRGRSRRSGRR